MFRVVVDIYKQAIAHHELAGPIPVILAKDETKVKNRVCWEHRLDAVTGFCGSKDEHVCIPTYKVILGLRSAGYNNIMDVFGNDKVGGFAQVIMVCLLHAKLPRLVLSVTYTCGCFDSIWVGSQWERIDCLWSAECLQIVGPIVCHASDGDSRHRQLMLADYLGKTGSRLRVPWEG